MVQKKIQTPSHPSKEKPFPRFDMLFKDVYVYIKHAIELIREKLSNAEFDTFDWSKMRLEKNTFSEGLTGDLLFTVPLKTLPDFFIPFFILFEHKSHYKKDIPVQVAGYMLEIIKAYSQEKKRHVMPGIVAIVFSHGKKEIKETLSLQDLLPEVYKELLQKECGQGPLSSLTKDMLNCKIRVYNVHDPDLQKRWKNLKTRIVLHLFKDKELLQSEDESVLEKELVGLLSHLKGVEDQDILLSSVQPYLLRGNKKCTLDFFNKCLLKASEKDEDLIKVEGGKMGNYVPMLERGLLEGLQKGRQEGLQEGRQEGLQEGRQEGLESVILNMLKRKMDMSTIAECAGVSKEKVLEIQKKAGL